MVTTRSGRSHPGFLGFYLGPFSHDSDGTPRVAIGYVTPNLRACPPRSVSANTSLESNRRHTCKKCSWQHSPFDSTCFAFYLEVFDGFLLELELFCLTRVSGCFLRGHFAILSSIDYRIRVLVLRDSRCDPDWNFLALRPFTDDSAGLAE